MLKKANYMTPEAQHRDNQAVKKILAGAFSDAQEILVLIELIRTQNGGGINERINSAGAGGAALVIRNAAIARLVLLVSRCFAKPMQGDLHLHRAIDLLKDANVSSRFNPDQSALTAATELFAKCKGDARQHKLKSFRDKFTAHLGERLEDVPELTYKELFDFSDLTVDCIEALCRALKINDGSVRDKANATPLATAFWKPWTA